jgi:hypothetical protein
MFNKQAGRGGGGYGGRGRGGRGQSNPNPPRVSNSHRMHTVLSSVTDTDAGSKIIVKSGVGSSEFVSKRAQIKARFQSHKDC